MDVVSTIVSVIQAIVKYAPDALKAYTAVKQFIAGLFGAGVISKEDQDKLFAYVDSVLAAHTAGEVPPAWTVEPDPPTPSA